MGVRDQHVVRVVRGLGARERKGVEVGNGAIRPLDPDGALGEHADVPEAAHGGSPPIIGSTRFYVEPEAIMREKIDVAEYAPTILRELPKGVLLTAQADGRANPMTIGWARWASSGAGSSSWPTSAAAASPTACWSGPASSRSACPCSRARRTTTSASARSLPCAAPRAGATRTRWPSSASRSWRASRVAVPAIKELPLTLECRVLYKGPQDEAQLPDDLRGHYYADDAPHNRLLRPDRERLPAEVAAGRRCRRAPG